MRGFIDDMLATIAAAGLTSQSAFVRGFIDDAREILNGLSSQKSQSAFVRGFIDDRQGVAATPAAGASLNPRSCAASSMTGASAHLCRASTRLNPRSCAASSMTSSELKRRAPLAVSQSAFVRGFIDDEGRLLRPLRDRRSQSAFVRGFIDDDSAHKRGKEQRNESQSAFVRGFIDDWHLRIETPRWTKRLNPRSCAASSMTARGRTRGGLPARLNPRSCAASSMTGDADNSFYRAWMSQSAFVRGFIDDRHDDLRRNPRPDVSIRVRARLHR